MRNYYYKLTMYVTVSANNEERAEELVLDYYNDFASLYRQGDADMEKVDETDDYK